MVSSLSARVFWEFLSVEGQILLVDELLQLLLNSIAKTDHHLSPVLLLKPVVNNLEN